MSYVLGLTGPTGSGKSTLCKYAETKGFKIIDCDLLAREAVKSQKVLSALCAAFSSDILNEDLSLNRKVLAEKAFSSSEKTELLNKTVLPFVVDLIKEKLELLKGEKIILDAPTLYESGADSLCDAVCVVTASSGIRENRVMARDNIGEDAAKLRINAGKNDEYYKQRTPHIIYNDDGVEKLIKDFSLILENLGGK